MRLRSLQRRAIPRINGRPSAKGRCEQKLRGPWANPFSAPVAQQISAAGFEPDGRRCNSCREHHLNQPTIRKNHYLKPDPIEQEEKKIRALTRELRKLDREIQNPPSVRLEEPIQRGWVRRHVLTKEAELHPDRETLAAILHDIGREEHSRHPLFLKKKHRRSRKLVDVKLPLHEILVDHWSTKRHPRPEEWKPHFHLEYKWHSWRGFQWFYVFTETHLFELRVEPHWLTHLKLIDPGLIRHKAELEAWMKHHNGGPRYRRLKGKWAHWRPLNSWNHQHELEKQEKNQLRRFLTSSEEAEVKSSSRCFHFSFFLFPHVAQCRGTPLRTETVRVQILSWGPLSCSRSPTSRGSRLKIGSVSVRIRPGAPAEGSNFQGA